MTQDAGAESTRQGEASITISVEYEADKVLDLPHREIIENIVLAALDYEGCPYETEVNVTFTDNGAIQEINREHRRTDAPTDVLSSPMVDYEPPSDSDHVEEAVEGYFNSEIGELVLGDTVISVDKVEEQAKKYGHPRIRRLVLPTVHSIFHLFGYDYMEDGEWLMTEGKQKEILETRGYTR